jgi:hypothetical protein
LETLNIWFLGDPLMGILDWLKPKQVKIDDPFFGELTYNKKSGDWRGNMQTPLAEEPLTIFIRSAIEGPNEMHRSAMQELFRRFPDLRRSIQIELYGEWKEVLKEFPREFEVYKSIDKPEKVDKVLQLGSIAIESENTFELQYEFRAELWPDAAIFIWIENWEPKSIGLSD